MIIILNFTLALSNITPTSYPTQCKCGYMFTSNDNLTKTHCTRPTGCPTESGYKILNVLDTLRIKCGLGKTLCEDIAYNAQNYLHHLDIFKLTNFDVLNCSSAVVPKIIAVQENLKKINEDGGIKLSTYIVLFNFTKIGETYATKIFEDYNNLIKFYEDNIDKKTSVEIRNYIASKINISSYTDTVYDIGKTLLENREILFKYLDLFKFKEVHSKTIRICITGSVRKVLDDNGNYFAPREKFADYITDKYNINCILDKAVTNSTNYVICDSPSGSNKARKAGNRLITSDKFVEIIKNL